MWKEGKIFNKKTKLCKYILNIKRASNCNYQVRCLNKAKKDGYCLEHYSYVKKNKLPSNSDVILETPIKCNQNNKLDSDGVSYHQQPMIRKKPNLSFEEEGFMERMKWNGKVKEIKK